jgi:phosphatidylserine/phosphatidylglycerophosphate/cardiolipin synthase-like enzyme
MSQKVGKVEIYAGPDAVGAPDNLKSVIVNFIKGAKKSLDIAVQEVDNQKIAKEIIAAKTRKVRVRMIIEHDYLRAKKPSKKPWKPGGSLEPNRTIHSAILRSAIDVKPDYNTKIFHQKFIIRDGESLLTGSTNFTDTGVGNNLNHIVIVHDKAVAKIYSREFAEIRQGHFGKLNEGHDPAPTDLVVSNVPIRILFAPDHNPEMEIMKQMLKAKKRIDFAIFTFARSSGIDDTMLKLRELNMPIRGAFDAVQGAQKWAAIPALKKAKCELYRVSPGGDLGKLHHKLMVIDEQVVIAGSFNYTAPANQTNDENIIILGDLQTPSSAQKKAQKKIAAFALNEINRIINDHGKKA